jgi:hypothetical protein
LQIARVCLAAQYPPHSAEDCATLETTNANAIEATTAILRVGLLETSFVTSASSSIGRKFQAHGRRNLRENSGAF